MSWILDKMFAEVATNLLDRMHETMKWSFGSCMTLYEPA